MTQIIEKSIHDNIIRGRQSRDDGDRAQDIVMEFMRISGFQCVERIETGYTVTWVKKIVRGKVVRVRPKDAFPIRKVSGDIRAIGARGITVHVEVKYRPNDRLLWSDFETHQTEHLQHVTEAGGMAFVAWVTSLFPAQMFFLLWPLSGFRKGKAFLTSDAVLHPAFKL